MLKSQTHLVYKDLHTVGVHNVRLKVWNMIVYLNGGLKWESGH